MTLEDAKVGRIGKYEVIGVLGRGAMGVVYHAKDPEIGREVAVKLLRKIPAQADPRATDLALERFRTEARSAGNLRHPNIVTIFEVNREGDSPYLVMDYVKGESLDQIIARDGRLPAALVMHYLRQAASALDYAHGSGVVHRDIKPGNLIIDNSDTLYVLDFGVAAFSKDLEMQPAETGTILGSPAYMSPEQILGEKVDHRSDLFSLASVAFECLTAQRPFMGDTLNVVMGNILSGRHRSLSGLAPDLPLALEAEFERAFARQPDQRFKSGSDMAKACCQALGLKEWQGFHTKSASTVRGRSPVQDWGEGTPVQPTAGGDSDQVPAAPDPNLPIAASDTLRLQAPSKLPEGAARSAPKMKEQPSKLRNRALESSPLVRFMTIFFAGVCVALGAFLFWVILGNSPAGTTEGSPALRPAPNSAPEATIAGPLLEGGPDSLQLPAVDPVPPRKDVYEMTDRELLGVLVDKNQREDLVLRALKASLQRPMAGLVEATLVQLDNSSYFVRVEAIKTLIALGDKRVVPALVLKLSDEEPVARGYAAKALGTLGDRKAVGYLMARYLKEDSAEVKAAIKKAIEKINGYPMRE